MGRRSIIYPRTQRALRACIIQTLEPRLMLCGLDDGGLDDLPGSPMPAGGNADSQPVIAGGPTSPLSSIPALNSDPGSPNTLYLDFHGEPSQNWGFQSIPATPAYDIDNDPTTFSSQELANIQEIWSRVSEAFSPFNVNVTTVDPGNWDLTGGRSQNTHQLREVIGGNGAWTGQTEGGVAYVGSFYSTNLPNTVYVFPANLANGDPQYTADDTAHEAGHGFGLQHQSTYNGTSKTAEYNTGNGTTAPFMGNPLARGIRATWWDGPSTTAYNVIQDDVSVLTSTLGLHPENVGHSAGAATVMTVAGNNISASGVIESTSQQDYFSFHVSTAGTESFSVNPAQYGPMLHAILELHDANNNLITTANSSVNLFQTITANLTPGNYYLVVKSYGQYGDIGQYTVSGTLAVGPSFTLSGAGSVNEGATYTLNLSGTDPGHTISSWLINWGDGSAAQTVSGNPSAVTHVFSIGPQTETISASVSDDLGTHAAGNTLVVSVAHVPPALSLSGNASVNEQAGYILNLSGSDPNHTISSWAINWGDGTAVQTLSGNPSSVTHTYAIGPHNYTISASATDEVGSYSAGNTLAVNVLHVPPTLSIAGASSVNEGSSYLLNLSGSDPGHTIGSWAINWGDGTAVQTVTGNLSSVSHTYAKGPRSWTIGATATDDVATYTASNTVAVTVIDVPPIIALSGAASVNEGSPYTLTLGAVTDPGHETVSGYIVHWGDGSTQTFSAAGAQTHTFATAGTKNIAVDVVDENGTHANSGTLSTAVAVVPPALAISGPGAVQVNGNYTLSLSAIEPAGKSISQWSINWDDGTAAQIVSGSLSAATHTFASTGNYTVSASATDPDGTWSASTVPVAVSSTPVFAIGGAVSVNEQSGYILNLYASDVGHAITGWTINWGDGSAAQSVSANPSSVTHTFATGPNSYTITAAVIDDAGTHAAGNTQAVSVLHVIPAASVSGPASASQGAAYTLNLSAADAGHAIQGWSINWGDGSAVQTISGNPTGVSHTFAALGSFSITATVSDDVGTYAATGAAVSVLDTTAPVAAATLGDITAAGSSGYTFTVRFSDNVAVRLASLGNANVLITGPDGFSQAAILSGVDQASDGSVLTATYQLTTPTWAFAQNGAYTAALFGNSVTDTSGNPAAAAALGTFTVNVPPPAVPLGTMPVRARRAGSGTLAAPGAEGFYAFTLTGPQIVTTNVSAQRPGLGMQLLDANNNVILSRTGRRSIAVTLTLGAGTYYVQVTSSATKSEHYQVATITRPVPPPKHVKQHRDRMPLPDLA